MQDKCRITGRGSGGLGGVALWEVARLGSPEFASVQTSPPDKVAKDAVT
jgi:hypothetical protein